MKRLLDSGLAVICFVLVVCLAGAWLAVAAFHTALDAVERFQ